MDADSKQFVAQMGSWIREQKILERQLERAVVYNEGLADSHKRVADLNR